MKQKTKAAVAECANLQKALQSARVAVDMSKEKLTANVEILASKRITINEIHRDISNADENITDQSNTVLDAIDEYGTNQKNDIKNDLNLHYANIISKKEIDIEK